MSLQAALSLKRNSATVDNPIVALSLTVSIISITIAYHSYRLHQETKQEQMAIHKYIAILCRILKEDRLNNIEANNQDQEETSVVFPTCIATKD